MIYDDPLFPTIDIALRRGVHLGLRNHPHLYQFLSDHFDEWKQFYTRYRCLLTHHSEGAFFLVPDEKGALLNTQVLPQACVHLALFILAELRNPGILKTGKTISIEEIVTKLEIASPVDVLRPIYAPNSRDANVAERIRREIRKMLDLLEKIGCISNKNGIITPLEGLAHFADAKRPINNQDPLTRERLSRESGVHWGVQEATDGEEVEEVDTPVVDESQDDDQGDEA